ncbi:unnamed protein product [Closterium sp. Yama58-4]|nr:unnamed protein product [Closterium sp. Yama58-4]
MRRSRIAILLLTVVALSCTAVHAESRAVSHAVNDAGSGSKEASVFERSSRAALSDVPDSAAGTFDEALGLNIPEGRAFIATLVVVARSNATGGDASAPAGAALGNSSLSPATFIYDVAYVPTNNTAKSTVPAPPPPCPPSPSQVPPSPLPPGNPFPTISPSPEKSQPCNPQTPPSSPGNSSPPPSPSPTPPTNNSQTPGPAGARGSAAASAAGSAAGSPQGIDYVFPSSTPSCSSGPYVSMLFIPLKPSCPSPPNTRQLTVITYKNIRYLRLRFGVPGKGCQRLYKFQLPHFLGRLVKGPVTMRVCAQGTPKKNSCGVMTLTAAVPSCRR